MSLRLAKVGWMNGNPRAIMNADITTVLDMIHYESFESDYTSAYEELNRENS